MSFIKEDYVLGNKKIVVGDNLHDLVLENLGKIWIRYGNSYKDFQSFISSVAKSTSDFSKVIIESAGIQDPEKYKQGSLVFDARKKILYLKYLDDLLILLEYDDKISEKYVSKAGDKMTGPLEIYYDGVPLKIKSAELVKNLNVEYLQGKTPEDFAQKKLNETITGNWTFQGNDVHNGHNDFNNSVDINGELLVTGEASFSGKSHFYNNTDFSKTATFKDNGTAIKIGTGDIVTDGSIGSSQFMSGMTGYGWRLDASTNTLTIDNLIVRGVLNVFELVVNKISATNGSLWITDSFKIDKIHNIVYLDELSYEDFIQSKSAIDELFNKEDYYIPITNYIETEIPDTNNHPYATRDEQSPEGLETPTFDFVKWIFNILKLDEFKSKFTLTTTESNREINVEVVLSNYLDILKTYGINTYLDSNNNLRIINILDSDIRLDNVQDLFTFISDNDKNEESNLYLTLENEILKTTDNKDISINIDDLETNIIIILNEIVLNITDPEYSINDLFSEEILYLLASQEIIELKHVFLKDPKSINELEIIPDTTFSIFPEGKNEFVNLLFTIVNSTDAILNDDGYYTFNDLALSRINLYYKYFGSNLSKGLNLYVLESNHDEYPLFKPGDILKCLKFNGNSIKQYHALVLGLISSYGFIVQLQNYSIILEGTSYSYNQEDKLSETNTFIDPSLYRKSEGLIVDLNDYLSKAKDLLYRYKSGEDITASQIHWAILVLIPESLVESYENNLSSALSNEDIGEQIDIILNNSISGLTLEELKLHPIFKKAFENSINGVPLKNDSLVRIGSIYPGDRRNSMYLTSSENNSPYQDVLVDINRPDYTVNYLTPKYKSFEGSFTYGGNTRKGKFFVLNKEFQSIMKIGDELKYNNKTWSLENIPTSVEKTYLFNLYEDEFENMLPKFENIYNLFRPYTILNQYTSGNNNEDIRQGSFVFNPSNLVYDNNNEIIMNEEGLYFTEDILNTITGINFSDNNHLLYLENNNTINITIGGL